MRRQHPCATSLVALVAYAWLVFQAVLPIVQSWRDAHRHTETPLAASHIELPAEQVRHCMHHREVTCPPDCHCPPEQGEGLVHEAAEAGVETQADLLAGETSYRPCSWGAAYAWEMGGLPLHALNPAETLVIWESVPSPIDMDSALWVGPSPEAPDKVPILSA